MLYIKGMAKKATNIEIDRRIHKIEVNGAYPDPN